MRVPRTATPLRPGDTSAIGPGAGSQTRKRGVMNGRGEPGSDEVTASTRAFEEIDARVSTDRDVEPRERRRPPVIGGEGSRRAPWRCTTAPIDLVAEHQRAHDERRSSTIENEQTVREE